MQNDDDAVIPVNSMATAKRLARTALPKRFFQTADAVERPDGFELRLDGKPARTPGKARLAVPSREFGVALAAEWNALADFIDPARMPITRIVNSAIDGVANNMAAVRADIIAHAGTDLVCYRVPYPQALVEQQAAGWQPLIDWLAAEFEAPLTASTGLAHVRQDERSLRRLGEVIEQFDPFTLAALHTVTTLTGSAVLGLAVAFARLSPAEAWSLGHVEEDWQIAHWGEDAEASRRRAARWREMEAAAFILGIKATAA